MRTQAKLKLAFYPLPLAEAKRIRGFLHFDSEVASVLDPCAGTGAALRALTDGAAVRRYGVELDAYRSEEARKTLDEVVQGSAFDTHTAVESFSLVYLNPPYDFEIGEGKNQRMERLFLEHVGRWVRPGGVLAMVIPFDRVYDCREVLTPQFRDKAIYRLTEPEAIAYKQTVVLGVRRPRQERQRLTDHAVQQANRKLNDLTRWYEEIPPLPDVPDRVYAVPSSPLARLEYRGLPLDVVEDLLATSPAWRQAQRVTHAPKTEFSGRPLTPLHKGHVDTIRLIVDFSCKSYGMGLFSTWRHSIVKMFQRSRPWQLAWFAGSVVVGRGCQHHFVSFCKPLLQATARGETQRFPERSGLAQTYCNTRSGSQVPGRA